MAWSTRELAELAGTSLRTVRHYHEVGLLPEPQRRANGYKQYGVAHLTRLLRITRLVALGFSLGQIAELGEQDEHPDEALRAVDADLAAQIEHLQRLRDELAEILDRSVPTDLPTEFAAASEHGLGEATRGFATVMGRALGPEGREIYAGLLDRERHDDSGLAEDFRRLDTDADDTTRDALAARIFDEVHALAADHPEMLALGVDSPQGTRNYLRTVDRAVEDLYNPAQVDVLHRLRRLLEAAPPGGDPSR
jgi:DNA-binding transcriptional MerR regulator